MATDTPDTFETVDWDDVNDIGFTVSRRELASGAFVLALVALFAYDRTLPRGVPTLNFPADLAVGGFTFTGVVWDFSQLDWLWVLTLGMMAFYVFVPLYQNKRLTAYYWRQFRKNRLAVASLVYLAVVFVLGLVGPTVLSEPTVHVLTKYQPPVLTSVANTVPIQCVGATANGMCHGTWHHPLGTTASGEDIATLMVFGMVTTMKIGLIVPLITIVIGTAVGTVAAYGGGMLDEVLMRYVDIQQTFPSFFLFLLLIYLFSPSLFLFVLVFGFFGWEGTARLVRGAALQRSEEEYVTAAASAGGSTAYIIRRHLVPNVSSTVITNVTLAIPGYILFQAALAFLGLGDPTSHSWGTVIAAGRSDLSTAWWISTIPGVFLFFTILAFNFVGDALRDALDPRTN